MSKLVRICPSCGKHNETAESFCFCGTLLADVDFTPVVEPAPPVVQPAASKVDAPAASVAPVLAPPTFITTSLLCPHSDCGQPNPPGSTRCVYCDRPLAAPSPQDELQFRLPASLRGRFRLRSQLPSVGGQADVWLAEDGQGRQCIIKLYRHGITPDWQVLARLAEVDCPHLVQVLEHGEADGVAFEVTEYCAAGDVRALLAHWPLPDAMLRNLLQQVSESLAALHARHILHRDLKPENLLLRTLTPLDVVLIDFGASSLKMATQYFTQGARTAHYAAPEVLTGVLDEKSDWWSLGMVLLEALRGRHPFEGLSEQIALHQLATASVEVSGVMDAQWRMLCRGLLLRNPAQRWGAEEVRRWLAGDDSLSMPEDSGSVLAVRPYRLVKLECRTRTDLALALAKHWDEGGKDFRRGVVLQWVEQELHDTNLARELDDVQQMASVSDDLKLLHAILRILPGIPPLWRGRVITRHTLLRAATQQNFPDGLHWLATLYDEQVLDVLAGYGHAEMADLAANWRADVQAYLALWERAKAIEAETRDDGGRGDVDYLLYLAPLRMNPPELRDILPDALLARLSPQQATNVRQAAWAQAAGVDCRWLNGWLAEQAEANVLAGFVAQRLLPFAQEDAQHEAGGRLREATQARQDLVLLLDQLTQSADDFWQFADLKQLDWQESHAAQQQADVWLALCARVQGQVSSSPFLAQIQSQMKPTEGEMQRLRIFVDRHIALLAVNRIWLQPNRLLLGAMILLSLWAFNTFLGLMLLLVTAAGSYWRWQDTRDSDQAALARLRRTLNLVLEFRRVIQAVRGKLETQQESPDVPPA